MKNKNPSHFLHNFSYSNSNYQTEKSSDKEILNWLQLYRSPNIGPIGFFKLLEIYGSVAEILDNFSEIQRTSIKKIILQSKAKVEKELEDLRKFGGDIILHCDQHFPESLKEIYDCPPLISVKGNLEFLKKDKIAVVGPRNASYNGKIIARKIAILIGQNSFLTASGMAAGIDSAVHEASLLSGTVAVLAGGIDNIYPPQNLKLYQEICRSGLIISEMPFGLIPKSSNFVQRNRIVSGLSKAVVVIEAGLRSGSLITARFGNEQGREIYAIPGSPFDLRCQGANLLIRDGANIITSLDEFSLEIAQLTKKKSAQKSFKINESGDKNSDSMFNKKSYFQNDKQKDAMLKNIQITLNSMTPKSFSDFEAKILSMLNSGPILIDELIEFLPEISISEINAALCRLELLEEIEIVQNQISRLLKREF